MRFVEYQTELFDEEQIRMEETAFRQLKQFPPPVDATYVAVPWAVLLNRHRKKKVSLRGVKVQGGVTLCQHIRFLDIIPACLSIGVETLFTPHAENRKYALETHLMRLLDKFAWSRNFVRDQVEAIKRFQILPCPHFAVNGVAPSEKKDLWFSFIGFDTHTSRKRLFAMPVPGQCIIKERKKWHFQVDSIQREQEKQEYQQVLARSRFSICPRGTGAGTLRFWESLEAGAIPVLISDALILPSGFDWSSCIVRVSECDVSAIPKLLSQIPLAREQQMRRNCLLANRKYSGEEFVSCIRTHFISERAAA